MRHRHWIIFALVAIIAVGAGAGAALYFAFPMQVSIAEGGTRSYLLNAPAGTLTTETNAAYKDAAAAGRKTAVSRLSWQGQTPEPTDYVGR